MHQLLCRAAFACLPVLLAACSIQPLSPDASRDSHPAAARAAATAASMVGRPYRYGGEEPNGFDCSGLVYYAYRSAGAIVPRVSRDQLRASRVVSLKDAQPGDLVFFKLANNASHVGIYLGEDRFVHAPSTGRSVEIQSLRSGYYERHFLRAGRLPQNR